MKLRILVALIVLALIAGVVYRTQIQQAGGDRKDGGGDRALSVKTVPVAVRDFPRVIDLPGTLEAAQQVAIVAQAGGTVLRQHVQEGDAGAGRAGCCSASMRGRRRRASRKARPRSPARAPRPPRRNRNWSA
jgi:hypothetical protein